MLSLKTAVYTAPAIAAGVVEFNNNGQLAPYCVVENRDSSASASIKYQESDDGSTWTDISGTTKTVNPGESDGQSITSARSFLRLHAGGNVQIQFSVARQVDGSPGNLGTA